MVTTEQLESIMFQSTGTEQYHKLSMLPLLATDGVADIVKAAESYWLVDAIASYQSSKVKVEYHFQLWYLISIGHKGHLFMVEDSLVDTHTDVISPLVFSQWIPYTDFPTGIWKFYVIDGVMLLPSEY